MSISNNSDSIYNILKPQLIKVHIHYSKLLKGLPEPKVE